MPQVVPVLSTVVPDSQISESVSAALDARLLEKAEFMALTDNLVQQLRPELERMATELVHRSLSQAWAARFRMDLD
jgi:hypothetical protein